MALACLPLPLLLLLSSSATRTARGGCTCAAADDADDCAALCDLWVATGSRTDLGGWGSGASVCTWGFQHGDMYAILQPRCLAHARPAPCTCLDRGACRAHRKHPPPVTLPLPQPKCGGALSPLNAAWSPRPATQVHRRVVRGRGWAARDVTGAGEHGPAACRGAPSLDRFSL